MGSIFVIFQNSGVSIQYFLKLYLIKKKKQREK